MAIGLYGGSFDPVHFGHLITTQFLFEKRNLEKIIFMPCQISPLKKDSNPISNIHRFEMLKLATKSNPNYLVSDYEITRSDVSYTFNTICELKKIYEKIELIIGLDNLLLFDRWYKPNEIFDLATVVVMKRYNKSVTYKINEYFNKAVIVDTPYIEISSTDIRDRIKNNLSIDYFVPSEVKEYIYKNRLYL